MPPKSIHKRDARARLDGAMISRGGVIGTAWGRRRARRLGAMLGIFALLLQASALLLHHTIAPHTHSFAAAAAFDDMAAAWTHDPADDVAAGPSGDHQKAPHRELPPCPVWTALHFLGGYVAPSEPALLLIIWVLVTTLAVAALPAIAFQAAGGGQPRAPPAPI
jgi:hypothetical protein